MRLDAHNLSNLNRQSRLPSNGPLPGTGFPNTTQLDAKTFEALLRYGAFNGGAGTLDVDGVNLGTTTQALTGGAPTNVLGFDPNDWTYFDQNDVAGDPNACGTTSLSMVLAHYGLIDKTLDGAKGVDHAVRAWGGFSAPEDLEQFAESKGLHSEGYNDQSFSDLENHLAAGRSVMAMVDGGGNPHWVVVQNTFEQNGQKFVTVADPGSGSSRTMTQAEFENIWSKPNQGNGGFVNDLMGYHNYLQVYDTKPLPGSNDFSIAYTQAAADGISDMGNAIMRDFPEIFTKGKIGGLVSGTTGLVGGLVSTLSAIPGAAGRIIEMGGDKVLGWASERWNKGGIGNKILGGLGFVGGGILKGLGWGVKQLGNVVAKFGHFIGSGITKVGAKIGEGINWVADKAWSGIKKVGEAIGEGAKKVGEAVVDGVKSVGKAIGNGIKKIFSGW